MEERVERQAAALRRFLAPRGDQLRRFIVDCAVELGTKTPTYAMLIGARAGQSQTGLCPISEFQGSRVY